MIYINIYCKKYEVHIEGDTAHIPDVPEGALAVQITNAIFANYPDVVNCHLKPEAKNELVEQDDEESETVVEEAEQESDLQGSSESQGCAC